MTDQTLPPYYNDLDATRDQALALIQRGVKDRRSGMHTFAVATIGADGAPRMRTVVNRGFDPQSRTLRFHTDARAPKLTEIADDPRVAVHLYDPKAKIQLRLTALASVHKDGDLRAAVWQATRDFSRECYRVVPAPGDSVSDPTAIPFTPGEDPEEGAQNFVAVTLAVSQIEWLFLAHQGHRRALFSWDSDGTVSQSWLVP